MNISLLTSRLSRISRPVQLNLVPGDASGVSPYPALDLVIVGTGQSNMRNWSSTTPPYNQDGEIALTTLLDAEHPEADNTFINGANGGAFLLKSAWLTSESRFYPGGNHIERHDWWITDDNGTMVDGPRFTDMLTIVADAGYSNNDITDVVWSQGESDQAEIYLMHIYEESYLAGMVWLLNRLRTVFPNLRTFYIRPMGRRAYSGAADSTAYGTVRRIQQQLAALYPSIVKYGSEVYDLPLKDEDYESGDDAVHRAAAAYTAEATRFGYEVLHRYVDHLGNFQGPVISGASYDGSVITVTVTHDNGTTLTDSAGTPYVSTPIDITPAADKLGAFLLYTPDGEELSISSVAITGTAEITVTPSMPLLRTGYILTYCDNSMCGAINGLTAPLDLTSIVLDNDPDNPLPLRASARVEVDGAGLSALATIPNLVSLFTAESMYNAAGTGSDAVVWTKQAGSGSSARKDDTSAAPVWHADSGMGLDIPGFYSDGSGATKLLVEHDIATTDDVTVFIVYTPDHDATDPTTGSVTNGVITTSGVGTAHQALFAVSQSRTSLGSTTALVGGSGNSLHTVHPSTTAVVAIRRDGTAGKTWDERGRIGEYTVGSTTIDTDGSTPVYALFNVVAKPTGIDTAQAFLGAIHAVVVIKEALSDGYVDEIRRALAEEYAVTCVDTLTLRAYPIEIAMLGMPYVGFYLQASGGVAPYTYSVSAGSLPAGISLDPDTGYVSGTPSESGSFPGITFLVTDSEGSTDTLNSALDLTVYDEFALTADPVLHGMLTRSYAGFTLSATGGFPDYGYEVLEGTLPTGLSLNETTGAVSGTPTAAGTFSGIVLNAYDKIANEISLDAISIVIAENLTISGTPVTTTMEDEAYAGFTLSAAGGTAPYTFSVASGSLPTGITVNGSTGAVSGTPTTAGTYSNIVLRVTDANGYTASLNSFSITVSPALAIGGSPVTYAMATRAYAGFTVSATGGTSPYSYSVASGALPTGISLNGSTGVVSGTPTTAGTHSITLRVTDNAGRTSDSSFTLTVAANLTISGTPVTSASQNVSYTGFTVSGAGGTAPYTFSVASGTLPSGITLNGSTGVVSGMPSGSGTSSGIVIRVTDNHGYTADLDAFSIAVAASVAFKQEVASLAFTDSSVNPDAGVTWASSFDMGYSLPVSYGARVVSNITSYSARCLYGKASMSSSALTASRASGMTETGAGGCTIKFAGIQLPSSLVESVQIITGTLSNLAAAGSTVSVALTTAVDASRSVAFIQPNAHLNASSSNPYFADLAVRVSDAGTHLELLASALLTSNTTRNYAIPVIQFKPGVLKNLHEVVSSIGTSATSVNSSIASLNGGSGVSMGDTILFPRGVLQGGTGSAAAQYAQAYAVLSNGSTVTAKRDASGGAGGTSLSVYTTVAEFNTGKVSVQHKEITLTSVASASVAITSSAIESSFLLLLGYTCSSTAASEERIYCTVTKDSDIQITAARPSSTNTAAVSVQDVRIL